jgi:hypothetical protein
LFLTRFLHGFPRVLIFIATLQKIPRLAALAVTEHHPVRA